MLQILAPSDDDLRGLLGEHLDGIVSVLGRKVRRQPPVADVQSGAGPSGSNTAVPPTKRRRVVVDPDDVTDLTEG